MKLAVLRRAVFESVRILRLGHRRISGEAAVDGLLEVAVDLARVVADANLPDAWQALQLVLVEDVATVVSGQVASVVPRLPEQTRQQRSRVRRLIATALQSSGKLQRNRKSSTVV